jgi:hypothetical protein
LAKTVTIPEELLRELVLELSRVGEVIATLEERATRRSSGS